MEPDHIAGGIFVLAGLALLLVAAPAEVHHVCAKYHVEVIDGASGASHYNCAFGLAPALTQAALFGIPLVGALFVASGASAFKTRPRGA